MLHKKHCVALLLNFDERKRVVSLMELLVAVDRRTKTTSTKRKRSGTRPTAPSPSAHSGLKANVAHSELVEERGTRKKRTVKLQSNGKSSLKRRALLLLKHDFALSNYPLNPAAVPTHDRHHSYYFNQGFISH